eukprot:gene21907-26534_t
MEKIRRDANVAHVEPTTAAEALFLILHGLLSQNGFVCVVEQASGVPGFEPSLRGRCPRSSGASRPTLTRLPLSLSHLSSSAVEIPPHVFVPSNWRAASGGERFRVTVTSVGARLTLRHLVRSPDTDGSLRRH